VARRARAFGMKILAMRRKPPEDDGLVDRWFRMDQRVEMARECDYLCVAAPLTPETRGLIGEAEIGAMKPGGVLINVGRGPVIDEQAMLRALREKGIRGAALDVFDVEPLPPDHPLWDMENVLISPHCADHIEGWLEDSVEFFVENFHRFSKGEPLLNLVDKRAGY
jgi:phosphoglycerate dehydrogenase-like enzyme